MKLAFGAIRPCNTPPVSKCTVSMHYYSSISATPNHKSIAFPQFEVSCSSLKHDSSQRSLAAAHSVKLGKRWMEFQGINNWEGLLDPLDDNLRREILRYGKFVEAAYRSFDFDPSSPTYATCLHPRNSLFSRTGIVETGYKITKNLRATCGVKLPRWFHKAHPNWVSTQSSWIGYVAVCQDKEEIARLGRRDVVIAYRGTATCLEWLENLRATLTDLPNHRDVPKEDGPMVESGFLSLYTSRTDACPSLQEMVREEIAKVIETYGDQDEPLSFTITGHSLGAALATLTAYDLTTNEKAPLVTVISFGGPRVGNKGFRSHLEESGSRILRIVNSDDVITKLPGFVFKDCEIARRKGVHVDGLPGWLQRCVEEMQWVYADVGQELRVSSRESPHHVIKKGDMATCHDLKTYLHLVNGFVSSTCPFRATAQT
ncbi:hypothetical protein F2P56_031774 [Juglans regia]|uniref:Phospholipase A(1) DAD1, chloroplastic-like n=2 Tax=Juglans regia TaxID=51240 RepID=A0A2I4HA76_JUGRE|nr:phospholipase A(1) DAD1, chloroplastic-like [Juglans regia]KAF5446121.1 hypothetical protein F2P56_031774 [Juglans regia]